MISIIAKSFIEDSVKLNTIGFVITGIYNYRRTN